MTCIKNKLKLNNVQIVKADKGRSIIIIFQNDYNDKIGNFISSNQLDTLCTTIRTPPINLSGILIPNPSNIRGLIKIH